MKRLLVALMLIPLAGFAAGPSGGATPKPEQRGGADGPWREQLQKRQRLMMVVGIAEALELNEAEALKLSEKVRTFEDRRKAIRREMAESMNVVHQASNGDQAALGQIDQATTRLLDDRTKIATLDKEMFQTLAKDLSPQRKAKLAIFLARFHAKGREMMHMGPDQGRGKGPGMMGPGMGTWMHGKGAGEGGWAPNSELE